MTDHEVDAAVGALALRYSEEKRKRLRLAAELTQQRQLLAAVARQLDWVPTFEFPETPLPPEVDALATSLQAPTAPYPEAGVLATLLTDLLATQHAIEYTRRLLKDAGVDVS